MRWHFIPAVGAMLAVIACLSLAPGRARAQGVGLGGDVLSDPFAFYYAIYLPNQQLQAMRPTPLDSVNDALVTRQYYAQSNRRSLYDPVSPYAETYDPLRPYSNQQAERGARVRPFVRDPSNSSGMGPSLYFNRIAQYYPDMANRTARHKNANLSSRPGGPRRGRTGMGGMGMGGMGMGGMGMGGMGMF